jgi:hypothetical protein
MSLLSQALKEAYASAPSNTIIFSTLELRHPAFTQPIRVVRDYQDLVATLEDSAPVNAGQSVTFIRFAFDITKPEVSSTGVPQVTITLDNVSREIVANVELAMDTRELIQVTYREYLNTDLSGPQNDPPITMVISTVSADVFKVTAVAGFPDLMNKKFPRTAYNSDEFPGLVP